MPPSAPKTTDPLTAAVIRGTISESVHLIHAVDLDHDGDLRGFAGNPALTTTFRSAAKPLQAIPAITMAAASALCLTDEEVAICCASHPGEPRHSALAASVLAISGFIPDNLICGGAGYPPSPLRHGCSGNHAAILLAAHLMGCPLAGYERPEHPAQQRILQVIQDLSGESSPAVAIDGCGIPTFGVSLVGMARAFGRLSDPDGPWRRIPQAMVRFPELIGSADWIDVRLMQVTAGRLVAKTGAEGLLCVGHAGNGAVIKVADGSTRPLGPAAISWLLHRGWLSEAEAADKRLADLRHPRITDPLGNQIGRICVMEAGSPIDQTESGLGLLPGSAQR